MYHNSEKQKARIKHESIMIVLFTQMENKIAEILLELKHLCLAKVIQSNLQLRENRVALCDCN
jgi:hypothetical protein